MRDKILIEKEPRNSYEKSVLTYLLKFQHLVVDKKSLTRHTCIESGRYGKINKLIEICFIFNL